MKDCTWVIVANSSTATLYQREKVGVLQKVHSFSHPESRLHARDMITDKPGQTTYGSSLHSVEEPHTTLKKHEMEVFAKEISTYLDKSRDEGLFTKLFIAAPPAFLGVLREKISTPTARLVAGEVDKDCTHVKVEEICQALPFSL